RPSTWLPSKSAGSASVHSATGEKVSLPGTGHQPSLGPPTLNDRATPQRTQWSSDSAVCRRAETSWARQRVAADGGAAGRYGAAHVTSSTAAGGVGVPGVGGRSERLGWPGW